MNQRSNALRTCNVLRMPVTRPHFREVTVKYERNAVNKFYLSCISACMVCMAPITAEVLCARSQDLFATVNAWGTFFGFSCKWQLLLPCTPLDDDGIKTTSVGRTAQGISHYAIVASHLLTLDCYMQYKYQISVTDSRNKYILILNSLYLNLLRSFFKYLMINFEWFAEFF